MCFGAFSGFLVLRAFDLGSGDCLINPVAAVAIAMIVAILVGAAFSLLLSFAAIKLKANQVIVGTAINILSTAFVVLVAWLIQGMGKTAISTPTWVRITVPFTLPANPGGWDYFALFWHNFFFENFYLTTPVIVIFLVLISLLYFKTSLGLRIRACGENPQAADSVGISVSKMRYIGTTIGGAMAGLAGFALCLAIGYDATVIGFGFLALAVMIFGNWYPGRIVLAGLLFAFCRVISNVEGILPALPLVNYQYIYYCIPYVVTLIVLIFTSKTSHAPKAEGIPYDKGA